jgi:hypothetical protein
VFEGLECEVGGGVESLSAVPEFLELGCAGRILPDRSGQFLTGGCSSRVVQICCRRADESCAGRLGLEGALWWAFDLRFRVMVGPFSLREIMSTVRWQWIVVHVFTENDPWLLLWHCPSHQESNGSSKRRSYTIIESPASSDITAEGPQHNE